MQIQFNKLKKETGFVCGATQPQVSHEAPLTAQPVQATILADKDVGSEIEPDKEEQEEQYEDVLEEKDKSD